MLYAFGVINDEFELVGKDEPDLNRQISQNLQRQHLREYIRSYYRKGLYIVKANSLPQAKKIATKLDSKQKQKRIFMPDLPLFQQGSDHNHTEVTPCPSSGTR